MKQTQNDELTTGNIREIGARSIIGNSNEKQYDDNITPPQIPSTGRILRNVQSEKDMRSSRE